MLNWLLDILNPNRIAERLNPTLRVTLHGIPFTIRKINPLDYFTGAKVLHQIHQTYETAGKGPPRELEEKDIERIKTHYRDTLIAGVVSVRCLGKELVPTRKAIGEAGPGEIPVANLMTDWELAEALYARIIIHTYGKKKLRHAPRSLAQSS